MPPRHKKPHATASEKRHDSGLIAPGKKIQKDKHVNQNGSAHHNGPHRLSNPSLTVPSSSPSPLPASPSDETSLEDALTNADAPRASKPLSSASRNNDASLDADAHSPAASTTDSHAARDRHVLANGTSDHHDSLEASSSVNSLESATTVIGPHPQWDVLAILMLLLQLPPIFLTLVQVSFAVMTFGNSSNLWSLFTLNPASEWFRSHGGNPSAVVSLVSDVIFFFLWISLPFLKTFVLDLAPAVVALSLGGGSAAKDSWKHASLCFGTVSIGHLLQDRQRRQYLSNLIWTALSKLSISNLPVISSSAILPFASGSASRSWARIILEIHIVVHGLIRVIRRSIDRSSQPRTTPTIAKVDPESASSPTPAASAQANVDSTPDANRNPSIDGRNAPAAYQPASTREKTMSSGKKRRKQATLVRSQQPFWAAIGTTKIQVSKEIEQSNTERDYFEAKAGSLTKLGNANHHTTDDRVWVTSVDQTEVSFSANLHQAMQNTSEPDSSANNSASRRSSEDPSLIDVRINGGFWSSVESYQESETPQDKAHIHGKVFGLAPSSTYLVEFVRPSEDDAIFSTAILTRPEDSSSGQVTNVTHPPLQDPTRPSSPVTTIKKSIEAAEARLTDHKTRSNKARKGRQGTGRNLKQDVSDLSRTLAQCGTNERQQQRQIQYKQNIKQAEEAVTELTAKVADLGGIPVSDQDAFDSSKSKWTEVDRRRQKLRKQMEAIKREGQRKSNEAYAENSKVRGKREKAESRLVSLTDRRKITTEENEAKRNIKAMNETQHAYKVDHWRSMELQTLRDVQIWEGHRRDLETKAAQFGYQDVAFDNGYPPSFKPNQQAPVPHTPESLFAGLAASGRPQSATTGPFGPSSYLMNTPPGPIMRGQQEPPRPRTRGRTSSMLSDISGFTDDETVPHAALAGAEIARNGSGSPRDVAGLSLSSSQRNSPAVVDEPRISPRQMKR